MGGYVEAGRGLSGELYATGIDSFRERCIISANDQAVLSNTSDSRPDEGGYLLSSISFALTNAKRIAFTLKGAQVIGADLMRVPEKSSSIAILPGVMAQRLPSMIPARRDSVSVADSY